VGLVGGLFVAWAFPLGEVGRRHRRFLGLFAAVALHLLVELTAATLSPHRSLV
jgi:hypothetical protein